ncbi:MAG: hypothetical protein IT439_00895 [Phycisphaerales bacterium]|nr:hypothetical protein [Phycisphaerales bacterium]
MKTAALIAAFASAGIPIATVHADVFLDLASVTPGSSGVGAFSGLLGGITVTGSISGAPVFSFNAIGSGLGDSTISGSSPQYSSSSVFSPTSPATDRIGFTYLSFAGNLVTLTFSAPVTGPVFHFANWDWMGASFLPTPGFTSLTLLNGNNGPDGDGVDPAFGGPAYSSALVYDHMPFTTDATPPTSTPPTTGDRSAYGSVRINGTFSTLVFVTDAMGPFSDSGSFTVSVPGPATLPAMVLAAVVSSPRRRRRPE